MRRDNPNYTNILEVLQVQHEEILGTFEDFKAKSGASRVVPFANLKAKIRQHSTGEETLFYPAVAALGSAEQALVTTAESEHGNVESALAAIESAGADNASGGQVTTLETALKNHIRSERAHVFAAARKGLTHNQLRELALQMGDYALTNTET